ncbi:MAG: divalent-cation tolerance protein CutA [Bradymonadia bacterium]
MKVILATCPTGQVNALARHLVESGLAACVNIIPSATSIYSWEGEVVEDKESLMLIKTNDTALQPLRQAFMKAHSYEVPEFVVLEVSDVDSSPEYLAWVNSVAPA